MEELLAAAKEENAKLQDLYMRALAEAENARRRAEESVEKAHKFGVEKFAKNLLPVLDSLEKGGFVTRCGDGQDKRRDRIEITPAGQTAYDAWRTCCRTMEERMLAGFTPEEQERFADYLSRAYRNLKTAGEGRS